MIPHFALPFEIEPDGSVRVVDQDSYEDVSQCVAVALLTPIGSRDELPTYGTPDITFLVDVPEGVIEACLDQWEPRASATLSSFPDQSDDLLRHVQVGLRRSGLG